MKQDRAYLYSTPDVPLETMNNRQMDPAVAAKARAAKAKGLSKAYPGGMIGVLAKTESDLAGVESDIEQKKQRRGIARFNAINNPNGSRPTQ